MPGASAFLRGFGIKKGMLISGYKLTDVKIDHHEIERYKKYEYPIKLTFTAQNGGGPIMLLSNLEMMVKGNRIINSQYGNPYECNFGKLKTTNVSSNNKIVVVESTGVGHRV